MPINLSQYGLLVDQGDREQALYQGLLGLGAQLMAGSAPSTQPGGFARGLASGGQAFSQGYRNSINDTLGRQFQGMQAMSAQQQMDVNQAKINAAQRDATLRGRLMLASSPEERMKIYNQMYPDKAMAAEIKANTPEYKVVGDQLFEVTPNLGVRNMGGPGKSQSSMGKLVDDLRNNRINAQQFQTAVDAMNRPLVDMGNNMNKYMVDRLDAEMQAANDAVGTINNLNRMSAAMKNANLGPGAKFGQAWDQVASVLGVGGATSAERLQNTRSIIQGLSEMTLQSRGMLKGQGTITDNEQRVLEKARSGDINELTASELKVIMDVSARAAKVRHDKFRATSSVAAKNKNLSGYMDMFTAPDLPAYNSPVIGMAPQPAPNVGGAKFIGFE